MEWHTAVDVIKPYIVGVSTPHGRGTGFLVSRSSVSPLYVIATAAHVVDEADHWEQPIRIQHYGSGESLLLHHDERVILIDQENDTAAIVFNGNHLPLPTDSLNLITPGKIKKVGVELGWLGFPAVSPQTLCFFSGHVSAHMRGDQTYLVDGVAINGVSGGPTFTCTGTLVEVVGVVSAYIPNRATGEALPGLSGIQEIVCHLGLGAFSDEICGQRTRNFSQGLAYGLKTHAVIPRMRALLHRRGVEPIFLVFYSYPHPLMFREFHRFKWAKHAMLLDGFEAFTPMETSCRYSTVVWVSLSNAVFSMAAFR